MRAIFLVFVAVGMFLPAALPAQTNCATRAVVIDKLQRAYGEEYVGGGVQNSQSIFEVWFSEEMGTWTILMTRADGMSCVMASGTNWREALPGMKKPAGIPN